MAGKARTEGPVTMVVLRFADGMKIEIVTGKTDKAAIAEVAGRAIAAGATLPLLDAVTGDIPRARLLELASGAPPPVAPDARPAIPIKGIVHALAAYVKQTSGKDPKILNARDALRDFFGRYGCPVDFAGEPEPPAEEPEAPARGEVEDPTNSHGGYQPPSRSPPVGPPRASQDRA
jgi:hypothetical protein